MLKKETYGVINKQQRAPESPVGPFTITLKNVDLSNNQTLVGGEFDLTDSYPGHNTKHLICDGSGEVEFGINNEGTWTLQQTKAKNGYHRISAQIEIKATALGLELLNPTNGNKVELTPSEFVLGNFTLTVKNAIQITEPEATPEPEPFEIKLHVYNDQLQPLAGAEFKLSADPEMVKCMAMSSDNKGEVVFSGLKQGQYFLAETKVPDGYILPTETDGKVKKYTIDAQIGSDGYNFLVNTEAAPNQRPQEISNGKFYDASTNDQHVLEGQIVNQKEETTDTETPPSKAMKVVTNNSLAELIRLVKTQSSNVLNVTVNHTIQSYTAMDVQTAKKKFYADIPCTKSKVSMNCDITPADSVEDTGLLTYAEPMEGKVRCYFMDEPTEAYTVEAIELTPVVSSVEANVREFLAGDVYAN